MKLPFTRDEVEFLLAAFSYYEPVVTNRRAMVERMKARRLIELDPTFRAPYRFAVRCTDAGRDVVRAHAKAGWLRLPPGGLRGLELKPPPRGGR